MLRPPSSGVRRLVFAGGTLVILLVSAFTGGTISIGGIGARLLRFLSSLSMFSSLSLSMTIHSSYPKRHDTPEDVGELYTEGPYSICRHPFYALMMVFQISLPLYFMSLWGVLVSLSMIPLWVYTIRLEESELLDFWGERYERYMREVPMFPLMRFTRRFMKDGNLANRS